MRAASEALYPSTRRQAVLAEPAAVRWCGLLVVAVLLSLLPATTRAADDEDGDKAPPLPEDIAEVARKFAGVTEWQGFFDSSTPGSTASSGSNFSKFWIIRAGGDACGSERIEEFLE